jgi:hypothetical protein
VSDAFRSSDGVESWPLVSHLTFVPLGGITVGPDDLQVAVSKEQVEAAPSIEQHGEELSQADEVRHSFDRPRPFFVARAMSTRLCDAYSACRPVTRKVD